MKLKHPIPEQRLDPKETVPNTILEQFPWHWNPMEEDHKDASCFMKNIEFDWKGLEAFAIKKCNEHLTPQKYWWYDYENEAVMHGQDNVNNMPIKEQAEIALKNK